MRGSGADLAPGDVVAGRFEIVGLLGRGGMGVVYEATQRALDRAVALKVLSGGSTDGEGARARFEREARVAATLRHPNAVEIYDFGEDDGRLYIAMERLRGQTLGDLLAPGPLSPDRIVEVAAVIARVLVEAHRVGLVHRDLKPGNIVLEAGEEGAERVVVADFGLAFIIDGEDVGRLTREGMMTGTPAYVSPEQALGRDVGPESDVYSLGCTLFEMATGGPPSRDESEVAVVTQHLFAHPPPLGEAREERDLPHALETLGQGMLAKRPEERPSAREVLAALESLAGTAGARDRGRGEAPLLPRTDRMIREAPALLDSRTLSEGNELQLAGSGLRLAIVGPIDEELRLGLAANGLETITFDEASDPGGADALYAPAASPEALSALETRGIPILTDTEASDMDRIAALLQVGVAEAVPRPVRPDELARRAWRAIQRSRRSRRQG